VESSTYTSARSKELDMRTYTLQDINSLRPQKQRGLSLLELAHHVDFEAEEFDRVSDMEVGSEITLDESIVIGRTG
jgi:hypothetical protein